MGQGISTAGRGEPRPRAAGIVGQLPRVPGETPGLPPRGVRPRWAPAFAQRRSRPGCVRHAAPFRSTCGTSLREARLEREPRNSRGRPARTPSRRRHWRVVWRLRNGSLHVDTGGRADTGPGPVGCGSSAAGAVVVGRRGSEAPCAAVTLAEAAISKALETVLRRSIPTSAAVGSGAVGLTRGGWLSTP